MKQRMLELLGLLMIGDGVASAMEPRRHCLLWEIGPEPCRKMIDSLVQHPEVTRGLGLLETAFGMWLASQQMPGRSWLSRFAR